MKYLSAIIILLAASAVAAAALPIVPAGKRLLRDDARIRIMQADGAEFFAVIAGNEDLEFKLETSLTKPWQVRCNNPAMVKISSEIKRKSGIWWQDFEIESRRRGECVLTFSRSDGKVMVLHLKLD